MIRESRAALIDFMEESKKSQKQISKETGLSTSVISQFLKEIYTGDNEEVAKSISQYLVVSTERLKLSSKVQFYENLYNTRQSIFVADYAHKNCEIALLSGDAGAGKTTALKYYAKVNTGVIYVTASPCIKSPVEILTAICTAMNKQAAKKRADIIGQLNNLLTGTNRLIIIDEADQLHFEALQAVRNLNDTAKVGIVLAGNDKIYRQMLTGRRGYEFDQLRTRIIVRKKVFNDYLVEEIAAIFPNLDEDCQAFFLQLACVESLRSAAKIYELAVKACENKKHISIDLLLKLKSQLLGDVL